MKTLRPIIVALGLLLAVSAAKAQDLVLSANIPFDFVVGNRVLPAGEYRLDTVFQDSGVIALRDQDQPSTTMTGTIPRSLAAPCKTTKLVFHRMGNEYFLYQIWVEGRATGRELPKSRIEVQMAKNQTRADEIIIAAVITH